VGKNGEDKKGRRARQSSFGEGNPDDDTSENKMKFYFFSLREFLLVQ
jgi:hypothetical protein